MFDKNATWCNTLAVGIFDDFYTIWQNPLFYLRKVHSSNFLRANQFSADFFFFFFCFLLSLLNQIVSSFSFTTTFHNTHMSVWKVHYRILMNNSHGSISTITQNTLNFGWILYGMMWSKTLIQYCNANTDYCASNEKGSQYAILMLMWYA